ncbi:hypothetical protein AB0D54_24175 [Streptomyces xanthophaeus]|uniref:ATP-dependent DNA ligase n=1 Tax=Streptomyces xanthophaeus TaxID=67385 RepID=UPI003424D169
MLATLSARRHFDEGRLFERKLDGARVLATCHQGEPRLLSRSGKPLDATYPEVVEARAAQDCPDFTLDGELVALRRGRTDFALLLQRMGLAAPEAVHATAVRVTYYLFDLLHLDGHDTARLPLAHPEGATARRLRVPPGAALHPPTATGTTPPLPATGRERPMTPKTQPTPPERIRASRRTVQIRRRLRPGEGRRARPPQTPG